MADGDFRLIAASGDTIDLNDLTDTHTGVQAVAGLTGFGLPLVEAQYQVGAGDGATFRGQRVTPRDVDLPIYIAGEHRGAMRAQVNRLARALAGECRLQWEDDGTTWELKVRRVGGGEFVYGTDTDGSTFLQTTITLRSGDPYWKSVIPHRQVRGASYGPQWFIPGDDMGNAPSRPTIKVTGPSLGFTIADDHNLSAAKNRIIYAAFIPGGETITVDMEKGTVTNGAGANMYLNLAPNPRFFSITPDPLGADIYVDVDVDSDLFHETVANSKVDNLIRDPDMRTTAFWALSGKDVSDDGDFEPMFLFASAYSFIDFEGKADTGALVWYPRRVHSIYDLPVIAGTVTGLEVGRTYDLLIKVDEISGDDLWARNFINVNAGYIMLQNGPGAARLIQLPPGGARPGWRKLTFTATATTARLDIAPPQGHRQYPQTLTNPADQQYEWGTQASLRISKAALVPTGTSYFDGNTPDRPEIVFDWLGTPNNSVSRAGADNNPVNTQIQLELPKRNWLVV